MKCISRLFVLISLLSLFFTGAAFAAISPPVSSAAGDVLSEESATPQYLPPDEFFALAAEEGIEPYAVQTEPNTPITSSTGLKGILLDLFGPYEPTITQLQYRQGSNQYYTYVNDISPDYVWLCAAGIFALVLFCVFRLGGGLLCRI